MTEERWFVVTCLAEKPGTVGFRSILLTAGSWDEGIGTGQRLLSEEYPDCKLHTFAAIEISEENKATARARQAR